MILNLHETTEKCIDCKSEFVPLRGGCKSVTLYSKQLCFNCNINNLKWLLSHKVNIMINNFNG